MAATRTSTVLLPRRAACGRERSACRPTFTSSFFACSSKIRMVSGSARVVERCPRCTWITWRKPGSWRDVDAADAGLERAGVADQLGPAAPALGDVVELGHLLADEPPGSSGSRSPPGAAGPAVTLKKPPTFTCPVIRVVADSSMVERIPLEQPEQQHQQRGDAGDGAARAAACAGGAGPGCGRRSGRAGSWRSLVRLHRPDRRDAGGQEGRVERGEDGHHEHDDEAPPRCCQGLSVGNSRGPEKKKYSVVVAARGCPASAAAR